MSKISGTSFPCDLLTHHSWSLTLGAIIITEIGIFSNLLFFTAIASFVLVVFLPGYCLSRLLYGSQINIWTLVFSIVASLFAAMLIALPSMIVYGEMIRIHLALSFGLFCVVCLTVELFVKPQSQTPGAPEIDLWFLIITITFMLLQVILFFVVWRNLEPYIRDWAYEVGMITQLRNFPATNPEAAWTLLKQPWGYWGVYALLVTLTALPTMTVLKIISIILAVTMLSLIYSLCTTFFHSSKIGAWATLFFATTSEIKWLMKSIANGRIVLSRMAQGSVQTSGDNLMFAWYNIPALIGSVFVIYFALRYYRNGEKADWIIALVAATILPFFHPTYYGLTIGGLALFVLIKRGWERDLWNWLAFIVTIIPFFLVYKFLIYESSYTPIPWSPVLSLGGIKDNLIWYIAYCGLLIPLALLSVMRAKEKASYIWPFALVPAVFAIITDLVGHNYHWYYDTHAFCLAVLASIGLVELGKAKTRIYQVGYVALIGFTILTVTNSPRIVGGAIKNYRVAPKFQDSDYDIANWIKTRTNTKDVFLTVPESSTTLVVEGLAERLILYGHTCLLHIEPPNKLLLVRTEIKSIFCSSDESLVRSLLKKYNVAYIIIGPDERTFLSTALSECRPILLEITSSVYQNSTYELLKIF